uniref:Uncharacterized protein n=1 Tax=Anopheles quadriannulatus TaxID=34691 RepID=A0A182X4E6_ANOQN
MKTIVAFALFIACVAHIHCFSYPSCGGNVFYTEEHPSGYLEEVVYNYPYPYRCAGVNHGYGDCKCPRCISYPSCGGNVFYTEEHPSGYLEEVVYNYPYPYRCAGVNHGYGDCKCPRCSPRLFTQQHVPCNTYH